MTSIAAENGPVLMGSSPLPPRAPLYKTRKEQQAEQRTEREEVDSSAANVSATGSHRLNLTLETSDKLQREERSRQRVVLCCSKEEAEDFQVDLCPRSWFDFKGSFCRAVWRLLVIICCLPICYPCYLTRRCRRRGKRVMDISSHHEVQRSPQRMAVTKAHKAKPERQQQQQQQQHV